MGDEIVLERILNGDEDPKDLPLALLQRITNNFSEDRKIGQGGFGVVYKGVLRNGIIVAVKRIDVNVITIDDVSFRREINSLLKINHQNVVRFLGFCSNTHHISIQEAGSSAVDFVNVRERLLCLEYISNGSLDKHITDELRGLEWETRYDIITGICKGLCHLKENKIIHMDLKPANILLDDHMIPKITDFGLSRPDENSHTMGQRFGTRGYFAPEYDNFGKTSFECDIYSLGVIIIELVTGCKGTADKDNVLERWKCRESNPPMTLLQYQQVTSCIEIAVHCREQEPKDRPHICDIISILSILSESESTDGHTAGQAKNRNIAESAFGKEKLGSSKKAEASLVRYMDINSSAQGPCTGQTEQYNLHPLQSFSRHYPTNKTYLGEESRAVDVTRGAMGSLLDKLGKLVKEDYNLDRSMKRDIESFSEGLTKIHKDLSKLEKLDLVKIWVDEVRELSYNIEDKVDSFLVHVEPDSTSSGFRELAHEGLNFLENDMTTHRQIGVVIRDIKSQVQAVTDKGKKYNIDVKNVVANATAKSTIDLRFLAIYVDEDQLIGMEEPRDVIIRLLEEDGDVSKLKIVSIVGMGGLGKTTLAKAVYDKLQAQYHHRAFVPVGQNPNVEKVLKNILFAFGKDFNAAHLELFQLINELKELLKKERYFIVIDDIWDSEEWDLITSAFPRNNHGSRVITTTRIERVARACCKHESKYVYRMKPLSEEDSRRLFFRRIFDPEKDCPDAPRKEEISKYILKKCGGMPLAINSIASLLAGEEESTWEYIWKSLRFVTEGDDLAKMKQILDLSYIHLPDHLKTCLLYVCMYPEDREIDKNDLLRQWVAEGFVVSKNGRLDAEEVAEKYFKELISMCMIQPGRIDHYSNEVLSCRVHDIILDLMRSKSSDENFSHVSDGSKTWAHGEIRRIWVHCNDKEDSAIFETIKGSLSHARSALFHYVSPVPYLPVFKYVRVLHIWLRNQDLDVTGITRLFLLRYLKIGLSFEELKLPDQIGELQHLETIDLKGCRLENYPSDIVRLPWLSHLRYGYVDGAVLPDGVERLQSLRTLEGVHLYDSSAENVKGLGKLTNLRKLQIFLKEFRKLDEATTDMHMDALHSSISKISSSLRILTLEASCYPYVWDVPQDWSSRPLFLDGSAIRELDLFCCRFERCPGWISQLSNLHKFTVMVREVADGLNLVSGLSSLAFFRLGICGVQLEEQKEEGVVIPGGGAFKALKELDLRCPKVALAFELGAMPKLEKLVMWFRYEMTPQFLPVGIQHLPAPTLKEIWLRVEEGDIEVKVKGSEDWDEYKWERFWDSDKCRDKQAKHDRKLKAMLKKAFQKHNRGADIYVLFDGHESVYLEEYSDEEYYEEDDNKEEDDEEYYFTEEDDETVDDEEHYSTEEDDEAAYQVNVSQTSAQVRADHTRQLVQFIEEQQDSGGLNITTDTAPAPLVDTSLRLEVGEGWQSGRGEGFSFSEDDDKREDCCNEEDDEAAHQVNESQTSAQVRADTRQLLQLIEEQKVSGRMCIETDVPLNLMVDTSLHLAAVFYKYKSEGQQVGHSEGFAVLESLQPSSTSQLAPSSPSSLDLTLALFTPLHCIPPLAKFPVGTNSGLLVQQGDNDMLVNGGDYYSGEEDDEAAYQVNGSQTSAHLLANTKQLLHLIEVQQDSGGMSISTDTAPALEVDTSLHLAVGLDGRQSGSGQHLESLQLPFTSLLAPSSSPLQPTLAPCSSLDRAEAVANFPVNISNGMLVNAVGHYLDLHQDPKGGLVDLNQAPDQLNDEELLELNEDVEPTSINCSSCVQAAINLGFVFLLRIQAMCNSCLRST